MKDTIIQNGRIQKGFLVEFFSALASQNRISAPLLTQLLVACRSLVNVRAEVISYSIAFFHETSLGQTEISIDRFKTDIVFRTMETLVFTCLRTSGHVQEYIDALFLNPGHFWLLGWIGGEFPEFLSTVPEFNPSSYSQNYHIVFSA